MIIDFSKFTSVKIGGKYEVLVIQEIDDVLKPDFTGRILIGGGNNLLISNSPAKMAILGKNFDYINLDDNCLQIGAATKSSKIYNFAKKNNLGGFEFLQNIPGTLGGMIKMNAGLCGACISYNLTSVLLTRGWVQKDEINFQYRFSGLDEPIFAAKFKKMPNFDTNLAASFALKRQNQPKGASFGSCFVNPQNNYAGKLIEEAGLKGYTVGGAKFSEQHANFLINFNNATFDDAIELINIAKTNIKQKFNIELKTEVVIV
ncbi:MAG: UDP-N-acetylmuramate dehydrogenase [Campylobacter sp.]